MPRPEPSNAAALPEEAAATRARLIAAAGEIFASRGFQAATVREICARAGANIAAVNYHFRDKTELYLAVIRQSMCTSTQQRDQMLRTGDPEDVLHATIAAMLRRMRSDSDSPAWHFRIMAHEMVAPTPVFARVVDEVIGPQHESLRSVISKLIGLPANHETTQFAANSVIGQVLFYAHGLPVIERMFAGFRMDERTATRIAEHIASFSLCSLRAMRAENERSSGARRASKGKR